MNPQRGYQDEGECNRESNKTKCGIVSAASHDLRLDLLALEHNSVCNRLFWDNCKTAPNTSASPLSVARGVSGCAGGAFDPFGRFGEAATILAS
jgi:hypothetical protein